LQSWLSSETNTRRETEKAVENVRAILYVAAYGCLLMVALAVSTAVGTAAYGLELALLFGVTISISYRLRLAGVKVEQVSYFAVLGSPLVLLLMGLGFAKEWWPLVPITATGPDAMLMLFMLWGLVIYSALMVTDSMVVFLLVPGLAILGLAATIDVNAPTLVYFMGFILGGIFLMFWENALRGLVVLVRAQPSRGLRRQAVHTLFLISLASFALTLLMAFPVSYGLMSVLPALRMMPLGTLANRNWTGFATSYAGFFSYVRVGNGPVGPGKAPLLEVYCDRPLLWRGRVYSKFDGHAWIAPNKVFYQRRLPPRGTTKLLDEELLAGLPERYDEVKQHFKIRARLPSILFAANQPASLISLSSALRSSRVSVTLSGDVELSAILLPGNEYEVVSRVPQEEAAKRFKGVKATSAYERSWLELPASSRVLKPLAEKIAAEGKTRYEKVKLLESYLEHKCTYNLRSPPIPFDRDAAVYFLTKSHQGVCDSFATALVVLCRNLEIPARFVTGFGTGDPLPEGGYLVRVKHTHAWCEVYFPHVGWVTFDPSPLHEISQTSLRESLQEVIRRFRHLAAFLRQHIIFVALALVGVFLVYTAVLSLLGVKPLEQHQTPDLATPCERRVITAYARALRALEKLGLKKEDHEGAQEFAARAYGRLHYLPVELYKPLEELTTLYNQARFGPHTCSEEDAAKAALLARLVAKGVNEIGARKRRT